MYKKSIFLFHKDMRLVDNTALIKACDLSKQVYPLFIFDPRQVSDHNSYKSDNAIDFMVSSLVELEHAISQKSGLLSCVCDDPLAYCEELFKSETIDALFFNKDYTPFALKRDAAFKKLCEKYGVACESLDDSTLTIPGSLLTGKRTPYTVFTPFYKNALKQPVREVRKLHSYPFASEYLKGSKSLAKTLTHFSYKKNSKKYVHGGVSEGEKILKTLGKFSHYDRTRDFPEQSTTFLAAHIKFGTLSIRQVYHAVLDKSGNATLLKELYWRDFFIQLAYHFPHVFTGAFHKEYDVIAWKQDKKLFAAWCEGYTGFPIVDAGMRQLKETGFMHNRVRMIVASFLTKNLHISWREGERYFAQHLTDYDPAVNNGNWQWAASTGADAQPYFRIFNPWMQQKKFDPSCSYIKKWVTELQDIPVSVIHNYYKNTTKIVNDYPLSIVDHATTSAYAKRLFKKSV